MTSDDEDFFQPWYGQDKDYVLKEFKLENLYEIIEALPDDTIVTMEMRDRIRIWYDKRTNKVTLVTTG